jgi:hypothetical protein
MFLFLVRAMGIQKRHSVHRTQAQDLYRGEQALAYILLNRTFLLVPGIHAVKTIKTMMDGRGLTRKKPSSKPS